ncbi:MAG TPA: Mpo1-like protein [Thermoanaerobaculia bacterium]|nr:Mpo1-like protein [Thermoanaerobaculia bacterium]
MKTIDTLLADYASYHRTRGNVAAHAVGITLILFGTVSLLGSLHIGALGPIAPLTAAEVIIGISFLFYLSLNVPVALAMLGELAALDVVARAVNDWRVGLIAFAVGWVFQGIGHAVYEKNSPAFLKNLVHLMVGPAFLLNELLKIRPVPGPAK